jgi:3-oxoadipate enol-lactonase
VIDQIYFEVRGSGPPLVLLVGLTQDVTLWDGFVDELARRHLVVTLDPRGAGRSTASVDGLSTDVMAVDALAIMDKLEIGRADVLGFSMGGMVAQVLAARHPERVRKLALVSSAARLGGVAKAAIRGVIQLFASGDCIIFANDVMAPWLLGEKALEEGTLVRAMAERRFIPSLEGFFAQVKALETHDGSELLPHIETPTLCICGEEDALITPREAKAMVKAMPAALYVELPGVGHMCPMEAPQSLLQIVLEFFRR